MGKRSNVLLGLSLLSAVNLSARFSSVKEIQDKTQNNIVNTISLDHEQIISMKISDLVAQYGWEKTQEIVREHSLIEINKYKKGKKYSVNFVLEKAAQNHANYFKKKNIFSHKGEDGAQVWDRVDDVGGYNYQTLSENISFRNNIKDVIYGYTKGQTTGHDEIFKESYEDVGIGLSDKSDNGWSEDNYYFVFVFGKRFK